MLTDLLIKNIVLFRLIVNGIHVSHALLILVCLKFAERWYTVIRAIWRHLLWLLWQYSTAILYFSSYWMVWLVISYWRYVALVVSGVVVTVGICNRSQMRTVNVNV